MALTLNSPGVFLNENDTSQVTEGPITVGAAIVGPTVTGPVNIPTVVTTYSQYKNIFGATFSDVNNVTQEYLTSIAAYNYFQQGGESLLVTRVVSGTYAPAVSYVESNYMISPLANSSTNTITSSTIDTYVSQHLAPSASFVIETLSEGELMNGLALGAGLFISGAIASKTGSAYTGSTLFVVDSLGAPTSSVNGPLFNSAYFHGASGSLVSGSTNNLRWEITAVNSASGEFSLNIRSGNDYNNKKTVLESWNNVSLDPNAPNYIEYVIGNQRSVPAVDAQGNWYLRTTGSYANNSRYIRIRSVNKPTPGYLDSLGNPKSQYTASLPLVGSGSLQGAFITAAGRVSATVTGSMFDQIPATTNLPIQGILSTDYTASIGLLSNKDQYNYNAITVPGLTLQNAPNVVATVVSNTQDRGDAIAVIDTVAYNTVNVSTVTDFAQGVDSSYAATYYPWLQLRSQETGKLVWAPASTVVPAAYEYNDKVGQPWFAPAGINRGALTTVVQPERRLTAADRDALYVGKVNPIAIFPGQGTVIYGQKTLQSANSALNRVNVRRLLIELKQNINQVAAGLLFEPNTTATRNSFLNQVNPYLSYVQQKQGLYAFQVVMDDTNNTADVIDRNQLVGAIYLQPTKTSEFIIVDFNITPTGATFGA